MFSNVRKTSHPAIKQFSPICRELVDGGKHFRKDALCDECLLAGKLRNVDTLLLHTQRRPPEQFSNGVGHIHEKLHSLRNPRHAWEQV
jgi:hypothetical protein